MSDPSSGTGSGWVIPPADPGEVNLYLAVAPEAQLTPELQAALEALVRAIDQAESVQGYATVPAKGSCRRLDSEPQCRPVSIEPGCAVHVQCRIKVTQPR
jgi:hypothetical protein